MTEKSRGERNAKAQHVFVTGYPGFIAKRLVKKLLLGDEKRLVTVLVEASRLDAATHEVASLRAVQASERLRVVSGDITSMDLGMSGSEYRHLIESATDVYHLAAMQKLASDRATAHKVNVEGTKNVLAFARSVKDLERFHYFSSAFVSGAMSGVITEDDLLPHTNFRNAYEATKHEAEAMVRAARDRLAITIFRPTAVVGDSRTGETDRFDGIYSFLILLAASPAAIPIPLPGDGSAPLNIVPVDYVVDAVCAIAAQPNSVDKTFHIVDPNPLSTRHVYELVAARAGRRIPRMHVAPQLTKALLRIPGLERWAPVSHQVVDYLNHFAFYRSVNTSEALESTGVRCPRFESYVDHLVEYVRRSMGALA